MFYLPCTCSQIFIAKETGPSGDQKLAWKRVLPNWTHWNGEEKKQIVDETQLGTLFNSIWLLGRKKFHFMWDSISGKNFLRMKWRDQTMVFNCVMKWSQIYRIVQFSSGDDNHFGGDPRREGISSRCLFILQTVNWREDEDLHWELNSGTELTRLSTWRIYDIFDGVHCLSQLVRVVP